MTTFDKREEGFEAKFAYDEEKQFKAKARRNRLLGQWAALKMGYEGAKIEEYADFISKKGVSLKDDQIIQLVQGDFEAIGSSVESAELGQKMNQFYVDALQQLGLTS